MEILEIPLQDILEPEVPIRSVADDEKMGELVESVDRVGLLQPLVVRVEGNHYRLIAGHRRLIALKASGAESAPCNIVEVTAAESAILSLEENLKREDVNPIDEAKYFQFMSAHHGMTRAEIGERIGKSREYVTRRIGLLRLDPDTQALVQRGDLAPSTATQLGRLKDPTRRAYLRNITVKHGAATAVVKEWVDDAVVRESYAEVGGSPAADVEVAPKSTYKAPTCFACERSVDEVLLEPFWLCRDCQKVVAAALEGVE